MIFGHKEKVEHFKHLIQKNKLSQSYLFFGDSQIGKFYFAKTLANYLENGVFGESTGLLVDGETFLPDEKGIIGVDAVRDKLKVFLTQTPLKSSRKLAIINDAHCLTSEAQSALLKIVEEPPSHALIIFITSRPQFLFGPLLSRLEGVYFRRFSKKELEDVLVSNFKIPARTAEKIALKSFGRLGLALSFLPKPPNKNTNIANGYKYNLDPLEEKILSLREDNAFKNSGLISKLIERKNLMERYNLNIRLQQKVIDYILTRTDADSPAKIFNENLSGQARTNTD